jgi:hypothetical protein
MLDANQFMREKVFREGELRKNGWRWRLVCGSQQASVGFEVDCTNLACPWIRLSYRLDRTGEAVDYKIHLDTTDPHFGGWRFWFVCPLMAGGRMCGRRVGKLYLPPSDRYFGCRQCYDLTYASCQRSDKRVSRSRRNSDLLDAILCSPERFNASQLALALKALGSH